VEYLPQVIASLSMHRVAIAVIIIQVELVTMVNILSFSLSSCVQIFGGGRAASRRPLSLFSLIFVHQHLPKASGGTWFTLVVIISIFT
jgi:hypothetical protein